MSGRPIRTLFISDVHLGTRGCQADRLLDFLRYHEADTTYLVGDIVDGWQLRASWYWPQAHNDVVQKLLRKARKGARMIYVPGNHDEFAQFGRAFNDMSAELERRIDELEDEKRRVQDAVGRFGARFLTADGRPAKVIALRTSRRSGPVLLAASRRVAARLPAVRLDAAVADSDKVSQRDHRTLIPLQEAGLGEVRVVVAASERQEAALIADVLRRAHLVDQVPWSSMAVLVRSAVRQVPALQRALSGAGVPFSSRAVPTSTSILCFFIRNVTPFESCAATPRERFTIASSITFGFSTESP